jgi:hypothetical protein
MRSRYLWPFGSLCVGLPVLVFFVPRLLAGGIRPDSIGHFDGWEPSAETIRKAVGVGSNTEYNDGRHVMFAQMFQQRFRSNDKAVGITFVSNDRMKAKFAATIPRWDMAHVASQLHKEAKELFGHSYTIDVYETYISLTPRKLAEVSESPEGKTLTVDFNAKFEGEPVMTMQNIRAATPVFVFIGYMSPSLYPCPASWFAVSQLQSQRMYGGRHSRHRPALGRTLERPAVAP